MQPDLIHAMLEHEELAAPRATPWWKIVITVMLIWGFFLILAALANYRDNMMDGKPTAFGNELALFVVILFPRAILSCVLAFFFQARGELLLNWRDLSKVLLLMLCLFVPLYTMYEMMYLLYREHHQWPSFADIVKQLSPVYFWVDSMVTLLAYSAQVAYSFWCVNQRKMIASNQARQKFLSLKLMQLQGQLEPYFLLNSLEGIESLVTDAERPLAIRALARLSDLLRYVLASTQNEWLSVADELQFARDYLALQELRFGDGLQIEWVLEERHWQAYFCPPLLIYGMMEYVMRRVSTRENAQPFRVRIEASILENHIHFLVQYSDHNTDEESTTSDKSPEFTPVFTPELEAAKLRLYILYEHTAFIQNVRQSMLHSTANSADEPLKNGIMLAFPVKESRDD